MQGYVEGYNWVLAFGILLVIYFYSTIFCEHGSPHQFDVLSVFDFKHCRWSSSMLAALILAFSSNLFAGLTHYGSGPAPIFFGSGYVKIADWWKLGFYISTVNFAIFLFVGILWWKSLNLFLNPNFHCIWCPRLE